MNRHGYKVRKFGRETDQRRALIKGLANQLVLQESIETTWPKAKAVAKYTEKVITKAKKAQKDLHVRRQVINSMQTLEAAHKLVDEISPKLADRNSGYLRIKRTTERRGDGAQLARVSFVNDIKAEKPKAGSKPSTSKEVKAKNEKPKAKQAEFKPANSSASQPKQVNQAAKRTGRRGNR